MFDRGSVVFTLVEDEFRSFIDYVGNEIILNSFFDDPEVLIFKFI